jgi:hypothetical protein
LVLSGFSQWPRGIPFLLLISYFRKNFCTLESRCQSQEFCFFFFFLLSSGYFSIAVPLIYYGLQHYLSLAGSLIFIPLIIVPAMGGTDVRMCFPAFIFVLQFKRATHCIHCINDHRRILPQWFQQCCWFLVLRQYCTLTLEPDFH